MKKPEHVRPIYHSLINQVISDFELIMSHWNN